MESISDSSHPTKSTSSLRLCGHMMVFMLSINWICDFADGFTGMKSRPGILDVSKGAGPESQLKATTVKIRIKVYAHRREGLWQ